MRRVLPSRSWMWGVPLLGLAACGPDDGSGLYDPETGEALAELQSCSNTSAQPGGCYDGAGASG